jgi:hypothetical protein
VLCHRSGSPAVAAGVTWTLVIASAPWAGREQHTSVIDAAGVIYVIGGWDGSTYLHDVWASTDGGARPAYIRGGSTGGTMGYYRGAEQVLQGTRGYHGVPWGTKWWSRITTVVKKRSYMGTNGVLSGYSRSFP